MNRRKHFSLAAQSSSMRKGDQSSPRTREGGLLESETPNEELLAKSVAFREERNRRGPLVGGADCSRGIACRFSLVPVHEHMQELPRVTLQRPGDWLDRTGPLQDLGKITADGQSDSHKYSVEGVRTEGPQHMPHHVVTRLGAYICDRKEAEAVLDVPGSFGVLQVHASAL